MAARVAIGTVVNVGNAVVIQPLATQNLDTSGGAEPTTSIAAPGGGAVSGAEINGTVDLLACPGEEYDDGRAIRIPAGDTRVLMLTGGQKVTVKEDTVLPGLD